MGIFKRSRQESQPHGTGAPVSADADLKTKTGFMARLRAHRRFEKTVRAKAGMHVLVKRADGTVEDLGWQHEEVEIPESVAKEVFREKGE